ncbi:MAG: DUF927 domain-containing protein [Geminicoccaceae bacterium]
MDDAKNPAVAGPQDDEEERMLAIAEGRAPAATPSNVVTLKPGQAQQAARRRGRASGGSRVRLQPSSASGEQQWPIRIQRFEELDWPVGVYVARQGDDDGAVEWEQLTRTLIEVVAGGRGEDGEGWGRVVVVTDEDGATHERVFEEGKLFGRGGAEGTVAALADMGARFCDTSPELARQITKFLHTWKPREQVALAKRPGWHEGSYVLGRTALSKTEDDRRVVPMFKVEDRHEHVEQGTLQEWQQEVARYAVNNSRLVTAIEASFAGMLCGLFGYPGGMVHFYEGSSCGKTTLLEVGASATGQSKIDWLSTSTAMETLAVMRNDGFLPLDEINQAASKALYESIYMLAQGRGKARGNRDGSARRVEQWRIVGVSTGEKSTVERIAEGKQLEATAGQMVRMIDIPAVPSGAKDNSVCEELHQFSGGKEIVDHLKASASRYRGSAVPALVFALRADVPGNKAKFDGWMKDLKAGLLKAAGGMVAPQVDRILDFFAVLGASGRLATELGVTGWPPGTAEQGTLKTCEDWLVQRGDPGLQGEVQLGVQRLRDYLQQNKDRFSQFEIQGANSAITTPPYKPTAQATGYRRAKVMTAAEMAKVTATHSAEHAKLLQEGQLLLNSIRRKRQAGEEVRLLKVRLREVRDAIREHGVTGGEMAVEYLLHPGKFKEICGGSYQKVAEHMVEKGLLRGPLTKPWHGQQVALPDHSKGDRPRMMVFPSHFLADR